MKDKNKKGASINYNKISIIIGQISNRINYFVKISF